MENKLLVGAIFLLLISIVLLFHEDKKRRDRIAAMDTAVRVEKHYIPVIDDDSYGDIIRICIEGYSYIMPRYNHSKNNYGSGITQMMEIVEGKMMPVRCSSEKNR